jgi:hypothetical protein
LWRAWCAKSRAARASNSASSSGRSQPRRIASRTARSSARASARRDARPASARVRRADPARPGRWRRGAGAGASAAALTGPWPRSRHRSHRPGRGSFLYRRDIGGQKAASASSSQIALTGLVAFPKGGRATECSVGSPSPGRPPRASAIARIAPQDRFPRASRELFPGVRGNGRRG